jgi:hypothetical protein
MATVAPAELAPIAGGLVVAQLDRDEAATSLLLDGLDADRLRRLVVLLARWCAEWLRLLCSLGSVYGDDPHAVMRAYLAERQVV